MDRDFDGKLSFEEFMGEETPLERLFRSMDKDGDGTVSKEVMLTSGVIIQCGHKRRFKRFCLFHGQNFTDTWTFDKYVLH